MLKSLSCLPLQFPPAFNFCSKQAKPSIISSIRNPNLRFDTPEWSVGMIPIYPQILKKKAKNIYEVLSNSNVLLLTFFNKNLVTLSLRRNNRRPGIKRGSSPSTSRSLGNS
jgi:hypothetical protein